MTRWILMLAAAVAYAAVLSFFSVRAHLGLQTQMNDLGNADQSLWAASQGDWNMTTSNHPDGVLRGRLALHANLIFWPISLLYRLWPDPILLLLLASLGCAAAGLGLFALARLRLGSASWWTLAPPAAFFFSPLVQSANLYDFHDVTLTTAFLVWAIWAFESERPRAGWLLLALALLCKEDVAAVVMMLGLREVLAGRRRRGWKIVLAGGLYGALVMGVLVPLINRGEFSIATPGPAERYMWVLEHPEGLAELIIRPDRLRLILYLLLSGAVVAWRAKSWLLLTIPALLLGILSWTTWMTRLTGTYYWITAQAFVILACLDAGAGSRRGRALGSRFPLVYLLAATALFSWLFSPLPYGYGAFWENYGIPDLRAVEDAKAIVAPEMAASVQNNLGPHFSHRTDIAAYPRRSDSADAVVLHLRYLGGPASGFFVRTAPRLMYRMGIEPLAEGVRRLARSPGWGLAYNRDGVYVFLRGRESILPLDEILSRIDADEVLMAASYEEALRHRSALARLIVEDLSWSDLAGILARKRPEDREP